MDALISVKFFLEKQDDLHNNKINKNIGFCLDRLSDHAEPIPCCEAEGKLRYQKTGISEFGVEA